MESTHLNIFSGERYFNWFHMAVMMLWFLTRQKAGEVLGALVHQNRIYFVGYCFGVYIYFDNFDNGIKLPKWVVV